MSSFATKRHSENNITNANESQNSEDLFGESLLSSNTSSSPLNRNKSPQGNSSGTSEELHLTPRRKPRKALNVSDSPYYSKKSSGSFRFGLNTSSSKFFCPITTDCSAVEANSSNQFENDQLNSSEAFDNRELHLSKKNVEEITFISESNNSDSSSILEDSLNCETPSSKNLFKTPVYSSVKKHIIRQWLSNVSLNCPLKPEENRTDFKHDFFPTEQHSSEVQNSLNTLKIDNCTSLSINHEECNQTFNITKLGTLNGVKERSSHNVESKSGSNEQSENEYSPGKSEIFGSHDHFQESNDELRNGNDNYNNMSANFTNIPRAKLNNCLEKSFHDKFLLKSDSNISIEDRPSTSFDKTSISFKSDDDSSSNVCYSTFNGTDQKNVSINQEVELDDNSFIQIRSTKKKRNCLNISSDDSEAKDTANDSEDTPYQNVDIYTPRRRLYFRNPLNNSLDDDAKPVIFDKGDSKITNSVGKNFNKNKSLLDQICSEVLDIHITNSTISPAQNQGVPNMFEESCNDTAESLSVTQMLSSVEVDNKQFIPKKCNAEKVSVNSISDHEFTQINYNDIDVNTTGKEFAISSPKTFNKSSNINVHDSSSKFPGGLLDDSSVKHVLMKSNGNILNCSTDKQFNVSKSNFFSISQVFNNDSMINSSYEENNRPSPIFTKSCSSGDHESSAKSPNELDESSDSVLIINRKSSKKNNALNISADDSLNANKSQSLNNEDSNVPICNISPKMKTHKKFIRTDDEYNKYIYRSRSDSSSSGSEGFIDNVKDSSENVITIDTTTSEEEDDNTPWVDLESYLKKNVPASSKSFESSFLKNIDKKKAKLASISLPSHSTCPEHTSFLLSLTPEVPEEMCHPDAVKYRGEFFSKNKFELVDILFKLFNKEIFDDKLPLLEIKWSGHLTTTSGITKSSSKITKKGKIRSSMIKLSKTVVNDAAKVRDVLLHELCHAANWLIDEQAAGHGPLFKKWVNKIWMKYPEVPKVKTTHHYELKWKYLYKCNYCGYELGKMKLSLDETSCRLCGGLVTVNT